MKVAVKLLDPSVPVPHRAVAGDAGLDLVAAEDVTLEPGQRAAVPTGVALALPEGHAGFVLARSGRALHEGLALANAPGLVDSGYRGEIKVIVVNLDPRGRIRLTRGEKIAQLIVQRIEDVTLEIVEDLPVSDRGELGFGSSGR